MTRPKADLEPSIDARNIPVRSFDHSLAVEARKLRSNFLTRAFLLRLRVFMPPNWVLGARRGISGTIERLPRRWRVRMDGLIDRVRGQSASIERHYASWIALYQQIDDRTKAAIEADIAKFRSAPLISVLMPVFNPSPDHLRAAIRSVQDQLYRQWELCIADDASTDPAIGVLLREAQAEDPRIKVVWRERNGHISAASNSALDLATGSYIALLDHDDLLSPRGFYEVVAQIVRQPDVDIVYSDEDRVDEAGRRSHPYFKPGWNPELMLGHNLISHLGVFRRTLVQRVDGFRLGFEGSQDYDLALRVLAETTPDRVVHVPMVLYHWRQGAASRTFSEASHDRCVLSGRQAVHEFAYHEHANVKVVPAPFVPVWTRVIYPVPVPAPLVSVIITAGGHPNSLRRCIDALLHKTDYPELEVMIVYSGLEEPEAFMVRHGLEANCRIRILHLAKASSIVSMQNRAVAQTSGSVILLLDPCLAGAAPGWLREMVSHAIRPSIGVVGAKLLNVEGRIRHAGLTVDTKAVAGRPFMHKHRTSIGYFGHLQLARNVSAASGDCLMVRRDSFVEAGGLNEAALPTTFSDVDLCLKLVEKGYRNLWTPHAELVYDAARSFEVRPTVNEAADVTREVAYMRARWGSKLRADPYWNPNLSLQFDELALAFPPRTDQLPDAKAA